MPTALRVEGYRISFFAADADEAPHVHVTRESKEAKLWLEPFVRLARNKGFRPHELNVIQRIVSARRDVLFEIWRDYFRR